MAPDTAAPTRAPSARATAWLVGSPADHERFTEMNERATKTASFGALITLTQIIAAFTYDWPLLVIIAAACAVIIASHYLSERFHTPEAASATTVTLLVHGSVSVTIADLIEPTA